MLNTDYIRLLHRKAILIELRQYILEQFIHKENPQVVTCDELPYAQREVPQDALLSVAEEFHMDINQITAELAGYELVKRNPLRKRTTDSGEEAGATGRRPGKRAKSKRKASSRGRGTTGDAGASPVPDSE